MPIFTIETPAGKKLTIEAPDEAQAMAGAQQWHVEQEKPSTTADVAKSAVSGVGKGLTALVGLPGDLAELGARGIDRATQFIGGKLGVDVQPREDRAPTYGSADTQKAVEGVTGEFYKPQTTAGKYAHTGGEFAAGLIGGRGLGPLVRRFITNVALPAFGSEAAGQATEGTKAEPYARIAGALLGGVAPNIAARAVTPAPASAARQRLVNILEGEGVTSLTAGQRTGNEALRTAESTLGNAPFTGQAANRVTRAGEEQLTEAAMRRAGSGPEATPEVLAKNQERLGKSFEDLSARNTLVMDKQFGADLTKALKGYERVPPSQQRAIVEGYAADIIDHIKAGGTMPGTFYQEMRSRLSDQAHSLRQSDPTLSKTLKRLRDALDDAMGRSISPADKKAWETTRKEYGAQKTIEKTMSGASEAAGEGRIPPQALRATVAAENRGAHARGQGQFSELARAASTIMKPVPDSGTARRSALYSMSNWLSGGAIPAVAGRLLMSKPMQNYLSNQRATPALNRLNPREAAIVSALLAGQQQLPTGQAGR